MSNKGKVALLIIISLIIAVSIPVGVYIVSQQQDIRREASVPGGEATVTLSPQTTNKNVGETFPVTVSFNTSGVAIQAVAVRLMYPYSGDLPEVLTSNLQISPVLQTTGDWTCPVKNVTPESNKVNIDVTCVNTSVAGFSSSTNIQLATFNLTANSLPVSNPVILTFDSAKSIITRKSNGEDVLLIPTSSTSYTIAGSQATTPPATATPTTSAASTPTSSPKSTATVKATSTATPTTSSTASGSATPSPFIPGTGAGPDSGVSAPTLFGIGMGALLLMMAVALVI